MVNLDNISKIKEPDFQSILGILTNELGLKITIVFIITTGEIINIFETNSLLVPDETNRKTLSIQGKKIDIDIFFKPNWKEDLKSYLNTKMPLAYNFSENYFGFVSFGIKNY